MSNRVVHFEIPTDNPEAAKAFFGKAFGWTFQSFGDDSYWLVSTGDPSQPGINGGLIKKRHPQQPLTNSIDVADLDAAMQAVEHAGGKIVVPKMAIPTVGWLAYFTDLDGNIHSLHQTDPSAR